MLAPTQAGTRLPAAVSSSQRAVHMAAFWDWDEMRDIEGFTDGHRTFRARCRAFVDKEIIPFVDDWEEQAHHIMAHPHNISTRAPTCPYLCLPTLNRATSRAICTRRPTPWACTAPVRDPERIPRHVGGVYVESYVGSRADLCSRM